MSIPFGNWASKQKQPNNSMNRSWVHPANALTQGHVIYNVKLLGHTEVDHPKGADVVKEAIRKLKFSRHIKKAEGSKPRKTELTISREGLTLQDPKSKEKLHSYPLHRISYCADDKTDKKICAFIAKESNNQHICYVFDSDKCAEEITYTVGQAFDLAYRQFLDTSGRDMEMKKQFIMLQKKLQEVEAENVTLRKRVAEMELLTGEKSNLPIPEKHAAKVQPTVALQKSSDSPSDSKPSSKAAPITLKEQAQQNEAPNPIGDQLFEMEPFSPTGAGTHNGFPATQSKSNVMLPLSSPPGPIAPAVPPPPQVPVRTRRKTSPTSALAPPPPVPARPRQQGATQKPSASAVDPFGSAPFSASNPNPSTPTTDYDRAISNIDEQMKELQEGFGSGLTMGNHDFSLEDLDPLNQK